jgi:hypothetical protein
MSAAATDLVDEYRQYLERFEAIGPGVEFGAYAKKSGRLVKKLRYEEFEVKWKEHRQIAKSYAQILERGDTINDVIVKLLRERSDELVIDFTF